MLSCVQFFHAMGFGRFSVLAEVVTLSASGIGALAVSLRNRHRPVIAQDVVAEAEAIMAGAARQGTREVNAGR